MFQGILKRKREEEDEEDDKRFFREKFIKVIDNAESGLYDPRSLFMCTRPFCYETVRCSNNIFRHKTMVHDGCKVTDGKGNVCGARFRQVRDIPIHYNLVHGGRKPILKVRDEPRPLCVQCFVKKYKDKTLPFYNEHVDVLGDIPDYELASELPNNSCCNLENPRETFVSHSNPSKKKIKVDEEKAIVVVGEQESHDHSGESSTDYYEDTSNEHCEEVDEFSEKLKEADGKLFEALKQEKELEQQNPVPRAPINYPTIDFIIDVFAKNGWRYQ